MGGRSMAKKKTEKKEKKPKEEAPKVEEEEETIWVCPECQYEMHRTDMVCIACGYERPAPEEVHEASRYQGYKVGLVLTAEAVPKKDKLLELCVDVGGEEPLQIVTNAPNVQEGSRVVVATVGSMVGDEVVKDAVVGGVKSNGM